ncbi:MAG: hypothetical protein WD894_24700 [Pirellulales bacterium]
MASDCDVDRLSPRPSDPHAIIQTSVALNAIVWCNNRLPAKWERYTSAVAGEREVAE